jgi:hypothetical protein
MSSAALRIGAALRIEDAGATDASAEYAAKYPFARNTRLTLTESCIMEKMARKLGVS